MEPALFGRRLAAKVVRCNLSIAVLMPVILLIAMLAAPVNAVAAVTFSELSGTFPDTTPWGMRVPSNWNGIVINDLDYVGARGGARSLYWMGRGYAVSGIARKPNRRYAFDPIQEIENLVTVLDILELNFGKPTRVISFGTSAGGEVALGFAEVHPERIAGSVAGGATTSLWTSGVRFDLYSAMKALLGPDDPMLGFLGLPDDSSAYASHWQQVIAAASQTPQGQAKLALAFTICQWNTWGVGLPRPDLTNTSQVLAGILAVASRVQSPHINTQFMFDFQDGPWIGNDGADYVKYWNNADPALKAVVAQLYQTAGLDLNADIATVNALPRTTTNHAVAAAKWYVTGGYMQRGIPKVPVYRMHTIGDPQVVISQMQVYNDQIRRNGKTPLYRSGYVAREGHIQFRVAEFAAAMELMNRRLDTGIWPNTSAVGMNALATSLNAATGTQGETAFVEFYMRPFNGEWRLDY